MFKRFLSVFIIIVVLVCTFTACSKDEEITVVYPISADPECLDPQIAENDVAVMITRNCMEGLVMLGENGEILPGVADRWKISKDGKTYIFHIREGACWQELNSHKEFLEKDYGDDFDYSLTADDCAFGLIRALRPETKAENAYMLYCIKNAAKVNTGILGEEALGIHASGDTLTITLERSNPDFIRILTYPMCMPCNRKFFEATGAKYGLEIKYTLCNGPFYAGYWATDSTLTLFQSEVYKGAAKTSIDKIYLNMNTDDEQVVKKFNQEDYNVIPVKASYADKIEKSGSVVLSKQTNIVKGLAFNSADTFLSNEKIRKALICATDLGVLDSSREYADGIIPPSCKWAGKTFRQCAGSAVKPQFNAVNAVKFYKEGLEELNVSNVNLSIFCTKEQREDMIRLIQNWQKLFGFGITVSVGVMGEEELEKAVLDGDYQIAIASVGAEDGSPIKFLQKFCTDGEGNIFSFSNESYDLLISKCIYIDEGEKILSDLRAAEHFLMADGVFYPLYNDESCFACRDELKDAYSVSNVADIDFSTRVIGNEQ